MKKVFCAVVALFLSTSAFAQQACDPCPDQGRTKIERAGKSKVTEIRCAQVVLNILGSSFSPPGKCVDSYVYRAADEFQCGSGDPVPGFCCDPKRHKVAIKIYGPDTTSPTVPSALPATVRDALKAVPCRAPRLTRATFNWSAGFVRCETNAVGTFGEAVHKELSGQGPYDDVA